MPLNGVQRSGAVTPQGKGQNSQATCACLEQKVYALLFSILCFRCDFLLPIERKRKIEREERREKKKRRPRGGIRTKNRE
jgi:hypothetical protein